MKLIACRCLLIPLVLQGFLTIARAAEPAAKKADRTIKLAEGKLTLTAPDGWVRKKPRSRIVAHEFAVPKVKGDKSDGRITFMRAGGGVDANIARWMGQFSQPDGKSTKDRAVVKQMKIAGQTVHVVDISGTFNERRGPFSAAPATPHKDHRMLGLIIVTERLGQYFVKLIGPQKTLAANEKAFNELAKSLKVN